MGKKIIIALTIFISFSLFSIEKIRITNGEWMPYLSEILYEYGLASHIVSEAFKLEGIEIHWGFFPWIRSYELARTGQWDASAVWWATDVAKRDFLISDAVIETSFVFFHLKEKDFEWEDVKDLKSLRIGFTRGYDYGIDFMTAIKKSEIQVVEVDSDEQGFNMLFHRRIDIFPNDPVVGYTMIENNFQIDEVKLFTNHPKEFAQRSLHLIVSKLSPKSTFFIEKFNSGLLKLKKSGKLDKMLMDFNNGVYD